MPELEKPVVERELRLAVVLYGGVSLAIYMHGATKELHRLVRASVQPPDEGSPSTPTEGVYHALLAAMVEEEGVRTRVVIDLIAGTSAGGINGVYLAKALAHDRSQDALRDLWLTRGDIAVLLRGPRAVPWKLRAPLVLATLPWRSALRGDAMAAWLHEALEDMDATRGSLSTLMPPDQRLRLFVTMTDHHGYARRVPLGDPPVIVDHRHRHVMEFRHGDGEDDFRTDPLDNVALTFAARATSCFPGAFGAVSFAGLGRALRRHRQLDLDLAPLAGRRVFRHYPLAGAAAEAAHFIDGGVLDNKPFSHVIRGIRQAPAARQVDRRLLYLEPSPAPLPEARRASGDETGSAAGSPGPLATVLASVAGIPRHEPVLDELLEIGRMNERVAALQDTIRTSWAPIAATVEASLGQGLLGDPPADPDDARLTEWRDVVHEEVVARAGLGYAAYTRAKVGDAIDHWAATLCRLSRYPDDCDQAALVRVALRSWGRRAGLLQEGSTDLTDAQVAFLRDFDLGYGERRLRFLIAALNWWYDPATEPDFPVPTRSQLDAGKARLYRALADLQAAMRGDGFDAALRSRIDTVVGEQGVAPYLSFGPAGAERFLADRRRELDEIAADARAQLQQALDGFGSRVYADVHALTAGWHVEARRRLLIRYLGFPLWDAALFPLQAVADLGERDAIALVRLSPRDAELLQPPGEGPKLAGTAHHHFGAFFTRDGRERDYLWGRLDTAERLVTLLLGADHPNRTAWCHRAFDAVLDEEAPALRNAADLIRSLRDRDSPDSVS